MPRPAIVWFRDDLRVSDNPALSAAVARGGPVVPVYVHEHPEDGTRPMGGASQWWLHHSLASLSRDLAALGAPLAILRGPAGAAIPALARSIGASLVTWNRRYGLTERELDTEVKTALRRHEIEAESSNAALLYEPWTVKSKTGAPLKVFSPFWRAALAGGEPKAPLPAPRRIPGLGADPSAGVGAVSLDDLRLLPTKPDWSGGLRETWTPGEAGAQARLAAFLAEGFKGYGSLRDRPDLPATSALSPYLRFGEIGPRQIWHAAAFAVAEGRTNASTSDLAKFQSELGWREFSYHLLFYHPDLARVNFQPRFDGFPWRSDPAGVEAWRRGRTGYPIVDAGMRQLWRTGWMHNRVRMIAASFLIKDLLVDWRVGEDWFWDTLVDADPASNAASWQWVAGSGADAAPYFRIFNPVSQGEKFDPQGDYVRRFVPELARLPAEWIHRPWEAPAAVLSSAGLRLGVDYPRPIVDHALARNRALGAVESVKPNVN
ncbi:MAG: deoxyribodipyrimidine photo-lyase [Alsobacter sp.]